MNHYSFVKVAELITKLQAFDQEDQIEVQMEHECDGKNWVRDGEIKRVAKKNGGVIIKTKWEPDQREMFNL